MRRTAQSSRRCDDVKPRAGAATAAPALFYSQHKNYLFILSLRRDTSASAFSFSFCFSLRPFSSSLLLLFSSSPAHSHPFTLPSGHSLFTSHLSPFPLTLFRLTSHALPSHLSLISSHTPPLFSPPPPIDRPGIWELVGPGFYRPDMVETCDGRGAAEDYAFPSFGPMLTTVWSSAAWAPGISILPMAFS